MKHNHCARDVCDQHNLLGLHEGINNLGWGMLIVG